MGELNIFTLIACKTVVVYEVKEFCKECYLAWQDLLIFTYVII